MGNDGKEIQGLKELIKQLEKIKGLNKSVVLKRAGYSLLKYSKINAPVKTGALRENSAVEDTKDGVNVVFKQDYAYYQEFGTSRGLKGSHYVERAITEHSDDIVGDAGKSIDDEISKLV